MKLKLIKRLKAFLIPTMAAMSLSLGVAGCSSSGDSESPDVEMVEGNNEFSNNNANELSDNVSLNGDAALNGEEEFNNSNVAENPAGDELQGLVSDGSAESAGEFAENEADPFASNQVQTDPLAAPQEPMPNTPPENVFAGTADAAEGEVAAEEGYEGEETEEVAAAPVPATEGAASMPGAVPEMGTKVAYYVATGDTLGTIAERIYGSRAKWREVAQENNITNPNKIFPGDVLYYTVNETSKAFADKYESAPRKTITVASGDTLSQISARVYGTQGAWRTLWKENAHIKNPDVIKVGSVITYRSVGEVAKLNNEDENNLIVQKSVEAEENHDQDAMFDMVVIQQ